MRTILNNLLSLAAILTLVPVGLTAAEWKIDTVDAAGAGMFTSLKVDASENEHMGFQAAPSGLSKQQDVLSVAQGKPR